MENQDDNFFTDKEGRHYQRIPQTREWVDVTSVLDMISELGGLDKVQMKSREVLAHLEARRIGVNSLNRAAEAVDFMRKFRDAIKELERYPPDYDEGRRV